MTKPHPAHIFLDANTALHFQRPDQIDWCSLVESKCVVLVSTPILSRELEQQKIHDSSRKLRERATAYVKWLVHFVRDPALEVRAGTTWHFIPVEPAIDFAALNLSPSIADDHLIASVIAYEGPDDAQVYVATADIGLEIKLRHRGIKPLLLADELKLPDEVDPLERENRDLRRQLSQRRVPALALVTETRSNRHHMSISPLVTVASAPSLAEIGHTHPSLHPPTPPPESAKDDPIAGLLHMGAALRSAILSPERVALYNRERDEFLVAYREFLDELLIWEEHKALTVEVRLSLSNTGTAPAGDVDIILRFPEDLILMTENDLPEKPEQPEPPQRPDRIPAIWDPFSVGSGFADRLSSAYLDTVTSHFDRSVEVDRKRHQANYWMKNLKHGFTEELGLLYFRFPNRQAVRQFHVGYEISAAEIPERIKDQLHFIS